MGRDRTRQRQAENRDRREARRQAVADTRAQETAARVAQRDAARKAALEDEERVFRLVHRRNVVAEFRFDGISVPYGDDPEHPEKGVVETTKAVLAALKAGVKGKPN